MKHGQVMPDGKVFWGMRKRKDGSKVAEFCKDVATFQKRTSKKNDRASFLRRRRTHWLNKYKEAQGCFSCLRSIKASGLAFHHEVEWEKSFSISDGIGERKPLRDLINEVSKCVVVCHVCHAVGHDEGWL